MSHDPERKKSSPIFEKHASHDKNGQNGHPYPGLRNGHVQENEEESDYPYAEEGESNEGILTDEIDHLILMHRDAHFGGDFGVMLAYYENDDHVGIHPDFDFERISYLAAVEKEIGQDLSPLILTGAEAEAVGKARHRYAQLKEIYDLEDAKNPFPRLITDLILSEEEEPLKEIEAVVQQGDAIVADLIALIEADEMYDPLYPGYGYAPCLAILCLGKIKNPHAVIPIFETFSKEIVFDEMVIVEALASIGKPAQEFLLKMLKIRPLTQDNLNAAFGLIAFSQILEVALTCFQQLQDFLVQEKPLLRAYLLSCCDVLKTSSYRESFIQMAKDPHTHADLRHEMQRMIAEWK